MTPFLVTAWDVHDSWGARRLREKAAWLESHGLDGNFIYRAEFYLADAPFARIYCYATDSQGNRYWAPDHTRDPHDHGPCHAAREEPRDVLLSELPPRELW